jgi:transposase
MYDFVNSVVNTTLYDRIYYARLYLDGDLSMRAIAIEADVHPTTIGKWVHDFNTYGYDMLTRAIAFNRG